MPIDLLIVDDSVAVRKVLQRLLRQAELPVGEVVEAGDGQEALAALAGRRVHLILTDINMPNMNGLEFLRRLKTDSSLSGIPVIVISTEGGKSTVMEAVELGAAGFIRKPFTTEQIRDKLAPFC
jgi:two-component system chemotaxis response regulator CheY